LCPTVTSNRGAVIPDLARRIRATLRESEQGSRAQAPTNPETVGDHSRPGRRALSRTTT